jgi:Uma2 family endonuclease
MTADQVMELPESSAMYELDEGRLVVLSPAAYWSSIVALAFGRRIAVFVRTHRLGVCAGPDGGTLLARGPDTLRAPDFSFVSRARIGGRLRRRGYFDGAPDFAIEVLSSTDRFAEVSRKVYQYLQAGTRLVWVVDPDARSVVIFRPGQAPEIVGPDGTLGGEEVLPGFTLALAEFWAELDDEA